MSAKNAASADQRTFLRTFEDWADWDRDFRSKANSAKSWHLINPDRDDQPLEEPVKPTFDAYFRKIPAQRIEPETPRDTRRSASQGSSQTLPTIPIIIPETNDPIERARSMAELTAEDRAAYESERRDYEQDYKKFEQQFRWIDKLKDWVTETVDKSLKASSCDPEQDLRSWYSNLKDSVGASTTEQQNEALAKYQRILSAVPRASKDFPKWLTEWEQATHQAQTKGIGGLDNPNVWFNNLCLAIRPVLGNWVSNFQGIYRDKLDDKSLAIRTVAKNLRLEVSQAGLQQPARAPKTQGRINRGFGPTYGQDPDQDDQPDERQDPDKEGQQGGPSGSAGPSRPKQNRKRKSDQSGSEAKKTKSKDDREQGNDRPICEACGGYWHNWPKCYYIVPSRAPAWYEFNPVIQDAVNHRLSLPEWKDKLKSLKGAAGSAKSD